MHSNGQIGYPTRVFCRGLTVLLGTVLAACLTCAAATAWAADPPAPDDPAVTPTPGYLDRLATFKTHLIREGPSPQPYKPQILPPGVEEITYQSGDLSLKAWVAYPPSASAAHNVPGVVFLHGGFGFGALDFKDAHPFLEAGFAVLCPMLRGENGNPGNMTMALREVDDANAAVTWLAAQPQVDPSHVYAFGFSAGGVISAMLSLRPSPIRHAASAGGLYGPALYDIDWLISTIPFDRSDPAERSMRVLIGNIAGLQRHHYAYVGAKDPDQQVELARREMPEGSNLTVIVMPGDHFQSLGPAVLDYIQRIREDL